MPLLQVTLGAGATQIFPQGTAQGVTSPKNFIVIQNNAANAVRVGDATVSATKGIQLASGNPGGSLQLSPGTPGILGFGSGLYLFGTQNEVIDVLYG
jgi:hypothetical protein